MGEEDKMKKLKELDKKKVALSITIDEDSFEWVKEDMKKHGVDISMSALFNFLLKDFVEIRKRKYEEKEKKKNEGDTIGKEK